MLVLGLLTSGVAQAQTVPPTTGDWTPTPAAGTPPAASGGLSLDKVKDGITAVPVVPDATAPVNAPPATPLVPVPAATAAAPTPAEPAPAPAEPPVPAPVMVNLDHPTVVDTATLKSADQTIGLYGIVGLTGDASQGLQSYLASGDEHLTCQSQPTSDFVCLTPDGTDLAEMTLLNGAARAKEDAPLAYHEQEAAAQAARRGIWSNLPPPPAVVAHPQVVDTATLAGGGQTYLLDGIQGVGAPYAGQMQGYITANGDTVSCEAEANPGHFICVLPDGTDIAKVALVNGAARVTPDAPDSYRLQQLDAINNRRGMWVNPPDNAMIASLQVDPQAACCAFVPGDDGVDGITYVGGEPTVLIDGEVVFLAFAGVAGWGYYDHYHHWQGAPDRYRNHLEHYHPGAHGLRGYRNGVEGHSVPGRAGPGYGGPGHGEAGHPGGVPPGGHPGGGYPGAAPGGGHPGGAPGGYAGGHPGGVPGGAPAGGHPGGYPGGAPAAGHPGGAPGAGHPGGYAGGAPAGGHPGGPAGGFARPAPSAAGFHPAAPAPRSAPPAAHAAPPPKKR
jgi:endonuclease YncB( thermonuclease family)